MDTRASAAWVTERKRIITVKLRRAATIAAFALLIASCTTETTVVPGEQVSVSGQQAPTETATVVETSDVPATTAEAVPTIAAVEPTTPPAPTAAPDPTPSPEPTATTPATVEPTSEPTAEQLAYVSALGPIRDPAGLPDDGTAYSDYVEITDDENLIVVTVPAEWDDIDRRNWDLDGDLIGPALTASPDRDGYRDGWGTPGLFIAASEDLPFETAEEFLDDFSFRDDCTYEGRHDYNDGLYVGLFDLYVNCGPEQSALVQLAATPEDASYLIEGQFIAVTERDWDAITEAVNTFTADLSRSSPTVEPLASVSSLGPIRGPAGLPDDGTAYSEYVEITDDDDQIVVTVPAEWGDIDGRTWDRDGDLIGPALTAASDLAGYRDAWSTPGLFIGASAVLPFETAEEYLDDTWYGESCTYEGRFDYDDGLYFGLFDLYVGCGEEQSAFVELVASPEDGSYLIEVQFIAVTDRDWDAIAEAVDSFIAELPRS